MSSRHHRATSESFARRLPDIHGRVGGCASCFHIYIQGADDACVVCVFLTHVLCVEQMTCVFEPPAAGRLTATEHRTDDDLTAGCHPDIAGEAGTEVCIILNEAYDTLMDEDARKVYDRDLQELRQAEALAKGGEFKPYTGQPLSTYVGSDPKQQGADARAVFVNETACIGCRQCNHSAPKTFMMEEDWGRARAFQQWADSEEDITIAIESCPVDCIHWVKQRNLPILEYAMQRCERQTVGVMNGGNVRVADPFDVANTMIRKGEEARARLGMDPTTALEGAANTGKMGMRIRDAWLRLGENIRGRWKAYDTARSSYMESMDEGDIEEGSGQDLNKSFFDFD